MTHMTFWLAQFSITVGEEINTRLTIDGFKGGAIDIPPIPDLFQFHAVLENVLNVRYLLPHIAPSRGEMLDPPLLIHFIPYKIP